MSARDIHATALANLDEPFRGELLVCGENQAMVDAELTGELARARQPIAERQRSRVQAAQDAGSKHLDYSHRLFVGHA